jgi:hypothetical protein
MDVYNARGRTTLSPPRLSAQSIRIKLWSTAMKDSAKSVIKDGTTRERVRVQSLPTFKRRFRMIKDSSTVMTSGAGHHGEEVRVPGQEAKTELSLGE